jgi:hypothetical protein
MRSQICDAGHAVSVKHGADAICRSTISQISAQISAQILVPFPTVAPNSPEPLILRCNKG